MSDAPLTSNRMLFPLVWLLDHTSQLVAKWIVWGGSMSLDQLKAIANRPDQAVLHIIFNRSLVYAMRIDKRFNVGYYCYE